MIGLPGPVLVVLLRDLHGPALRVDGGDDRDVAEAQVGRAVDDQVARARRL